MSKIMPSIYFADNKDGVITLTYGEVIDEEVAIWGELVMSPKQAEGLAKILNREVKYPKKSAPTAIKESEEL